MAATITKISRTNCVRFFKEHVICDYCGIETRALVYAESQQVVCSSCKGVLLDVDMDRDDDPREGMMIVAYIPEGYNGEED